MNGKGKTTIDDGGEFRFEVEELNASRVVLTGESSDWPAVGESLHKFIGREGYLVRISHVDEGVKGKKRQREDESTTSALSTPGVVIDVDVLPTEAKKIRQEKEVIYTDGACTNNGKRGATAGYGVHFPSEPHRDISGKLKGLQTNQRAELQAIVGG
eukprot:Trichotokara_eunicae@DN6220_c0_g1_i1.p1